MRRRALLAAAAAGGLAGCLDDVGIGATPTPTPSRGCAVDDGDLPVGSENLRTALPKDRIPAVVDPAFGEDWTDLAVPEYSRYDGEGPKLPGEAPVVGVEQGGAARAYPLRVLDWHEVVNDALPAADGDLPLLVTYCPLCGSAVAFERRVGGRPATFGVSGRLWCSNLVLYDRPTGSFWSQLRGLAIRGPETGARLRPVPTSLTTWAAWQRQHPDAAVLLPPPRSDTVRGRDVGFDYFVDRYPHGGDGVVGPGSETDGRYPKTLVVGVTDGDAARAYPYPVVAEAGVVEDVVADRPVVVALAPGSTLVAYDRRVAGERLRFAADGEAHLRAGGSRWERATGRAVDGPHEGRRLTDASGASPMFWKAWSEFHPGTTVYGEA